MIDYTQHQRQTAAASNAAVHNELQRLARQRFEQFSSDWQKPAIEGMTVILHKASEALDQTLLCGAVRRRVIGDCRQVRVFAPVNPQTSATKVLRCFSRWPVGRG